MVVIHLKSPFVSLIISTISVFAEFALFTAIVLFNRYVECIALRKGRSISVRRHQRRVNIICYAALLIFFILEIITSFVTEPALRLPLADQKCIATNAISRLEGPSGVFAEEITMVRAENYSKIEDRVKCSDSAVMDFPVINPMEYVLEGAKEPSSENPDPDPLLFCRDRGCVVARTIHSQSDSNSTLISLSEYIRMQSLNSFREEQTKIPVLYTRIYFECEACLQQFASRVLDAYNQNSSDPMESRRRAFLGSEERTCPFGEELSDTEVPLGLVYSVAVVWTLSFMSVVSTILLRRHIFYDISNPLHWAKKTKHSDDELIEGDPVVMSIHENGKQVVYVFGASPKPTDIHSRFAFGM